MSTTVQPTEVALAAERLNLGCNTDYREGWCNLDANEDVEADVYADLEAAPWPFPANSFTQILASHVFEHLEDMEGALRECARLLRPGGELVVRHPIGQDWVEDPGHLPKNEWDWRTPLRYCGLEPWDCDVGLEVADRDVNLWSQHPCREVHQRYLDTKLARYGAGRWCFARGQWSGEFIVTFRKPPEGDA